MKTSQDMLFHRSLASIDWDEICGRLSTYCQTHGGHTLAVNLRPELTATKILSLVALSRGLLACGSDIYEMNLSICDELPDILSTLNDGHIAEPKELLVLTDFLGLRKRLERATEHVWEDMPEIKTFLAHPYERGKLIKEIENRITHHGEVKWDASPKLAYLSRQEASDRENIEKALDVVVKKSGYQAMLMDRYVTLRDGRYVLPVKIQHQNEVKGIIHDVSNSKKTAFIEPLQIVKINNHLIQVLEAKQEERYKILRHLANLVLSMLASIEGDLSLMYELDLILAKLKLGQSWDGILIEPEKNTTWQGMELKNVIHPMLEGEKNQPVVANTVELSSSESGLIISGPNLGGKTVLLKSVGCALMLAYCGIPIPCGAQTHIPIFSWCRFVIGDQQSIQDGYSSYTFQIEMIKDIPPRAGMGLVIVDEIISATDPEEGEALAQALLGAWVRDPKVICLVSTHYASIKSLSVTGHLPLAYGSMAYVKGRPTYRFLVGSFGQSFGLETAEHKGISKEVINEAKSLMGEKKVEINQLVGTLQEKVARSEQMADQLKLKEKNFEKKLKELEKKEQSLDEDRQGMEVKVTNEVWQQYEGVIKDVRQMIAEKQQQKDLKKLAKAEEKMTHVISDIRGKLTKIAAKRQPNKGEWYYISHLGKVQVLEWHQDKKYALVKVKDKTIRLSLEHFSQAKKM